MLLVAGTSDPAQLRHPLPNLATWKLVALVPAVASALSLLVLGALALCAAVIIQSARRLRSGC